MASDTELDNGTIRLHLGANREGVPCILSALWADTGETVFTNAADNHAWEAWLPEAFLPAGGPATAWRVEEDPHFLHATSSCAMNGGLQATWMVELFREGALFRAWILLENIGDAPCEVSRLPAWNGVWHAQKAAWLRYWRSLSFETVEISLDGSDITLGSRLHSSDEIEDGVNPYWIWGGDAGRIYFALSWCGGWRAHLNSGNDGQELDFRIFLPPEETQLTLLPGESITGPVLQVFFTRETNDRECRAAWMRQRAALGRVLYGGPGPWYPFAYNNWYTTRFDVTESFLRRQMEALDPFGFDVFIVDAGWYAAVGQWEPDPDKYDPGAFESILAAIREKGIMTGIWSCPQFIRATADALPPEAEQPPFYRKFIDGYLLDYAGMDFTRHLLDHVQALRDRYGAGWWKYDQDFFVARTRHGVAKNVVALQGALLAVRKAHPDLYMENCQSGGRMINEFTVLMTQNQWIRDGGGTGPAHARSNLSEALGALEFMPPWTVNRWTNNPDRNDPRDDEFTKRYCRSAMAGTWGLAADLPKITERQRATIVREAAHYRRLNALKTDCRYDVLHPSRAAKAAGVVYYDAAGRQAAVLLLRWNAKGAFIPPVRLEGLLADAVYRVEDVDTGETREISGAVFWKEGLGIAFDKGRQSALVFVEAVGQ